MKDTILCDAVAGREEYQKNTDDLEMLEKVGKLKPEVVYSASVS